MSNIPKNNPLTLKRIVEGMDQISDKMNFGSDAKQLSSDQKRKLMEMASMFESYGQAIQNEEAIMNSAKGLTELCELAELYATNECGDVFQENIVKKDMNEVKKRISEYQKIAKEAYARMQQLGVAYQDIGHILGRYYDLGQNKGSSEKLPQGGGAQPLQNEDMDRVCAWCKQPMGKAPGQAGKTTHGICDKCKGDVLNGTYKQPGEEAEKVNPVSAPVSAPVSEDNGKPMYENLWDKFRGKDTKSDIGLKKDFGPKCQKCGNPADPNISTTNSGKPWCRKCWLANGGI